MAYIEIIQPEDKRGQRLDIEKDEVTIGRIEDNDLPIQDAAASSHHCKIIRKDKQYTLRDLGSTNGTLLNDAPIAQARLSSGDVITVGSVEIKIQGDDIEGGGDAREGNGGTSAGNTVVLERPRGNTPSAFGTRRNTKGIWITLGILTALLLAGLLYWFVTVLFAG